MAIRRLRRLDGLDLDLDTEPARASIRQLGDLRPAAAWADHADPVTGDVSSQLHQAASAGL